MSQRLRQLLSPSSIAFFGGTDAADAITQCRRAGFEGDLWAVNPGRKELSGIPCFRSVNELPAAPDAAFVAAPPDASIDIIRSLAAMGAGGAVCYTSGFAEAGADGRQEQLVDVAGDMPVIGPNCHGFLNYFDHAALWPDQHGGKAIEQGVGIVLQSGNIGINLTMQQRGLDIGYVITVGNSATLGLHDYIHALLGDDRVTAIGLHIEGIDDIPAFSEAAIAARQQGIPIVVIKTGRSERGAEITLSHTASLSGSDELYSALFKRLGIARCDTLSQFLETLKFVSRVGLPDHRQIASMSCSGGEASIVADAAARLGLEFAEFDESRTNAIQASLGDKVSVSNPLDYHTYAWGDYDSLYACFREVLSEDLACCLLVLDYPVGEGLDVSGWLVTENALVAAMQDTGTPAVIVSSLPETMPVEHIQRLHANDIAAMQGLDDCLFAIAAALDMAATKDPNALSRFAAIQSEGDQLDEVQSKQALERTGLKTPHRKQVEAEAVAEAADKIGYPVVLKAISPDIAHKTEAGAVAVNIQNTQGLQNTLDRMQGLSGEFLVEKMIEDALCELLVGVRRDPDFGLVLVIGAGGTLVELVRDTVSLLFPVSSQDIHAAIGGLSVSRLLDGFRGAPAVNREVVVESILAIVRYAEDNSDTLLELDVNPLLITPNGAVAVDALVRKVNE